MNSQLWNSIINIGSIQRIIYCRFRGRGITIPGINTIEHVQVHVYLQSRK